MSFQSWLQGFQGPQIEAGPSRIGSPMGEAAGAMYDKFAKMTGTAQLPGFDGQPMGADWFTSQSAPNEHYGISKGGGVGGYQSSPAAAYVEGLVSAAAKGGAGIDVDPGYYMDLQQQFGAAKDFYMSQAGPGGMLSDTSMNPYARQLSAQHQMQQAQAQRDMGYGMAASGANPFMAQHQMRDAAYGANQAYGQSLAQIEEDLMNRRFAAGEGLVNLSGALGSEMTARREEQRRFGLEHLQADRLGKMNASAQKSAGRASMFGDIAGAAIGALA